MLTVKTENGKLKERISDLLDIAFEDDNNASVSEDSSVLFLIQNHCENGSTKKDPCIVFNKRSQKVRQPGDICCPGGGISPYIDQRIASLLKLPFINRLVSKRRCTHKSCHNLKSDKTALMLAAGLREGFEEMRLNPFGLTVLGVLPVQRLVMFKKKIYPVVCWINGQKKFYPNWEVEKIIHIPIAHLLRSDGYACYRIETHVQNDNRNATMDLPCFVHKGKDGKELLWGATYRITQNFLQKVYGFTPPQINTLPVVRGVLETSYLNGPPKRT